MTLTGKAREVLPALEAQSSAMEKEVTAALIAEEYAALLAILQKLSAGLGSARVCTPGWRSRPH